MKKVVLVVIDALASRIVEPAIADSRLPTLRALAQAGSVAYDCVSIFPSITPAATASIVTGVYPSEHGVAGAFWYDRDEDRINYFGDDLWIILREGFGKFFQDFLLTLNYKILSVETLFQHLRRCGLQSACLNYLWFRGDVEHDVNVPLLMSLLPGVPYRETVKGPPILALGDLVTTTLESTGKPLEGRGGASRRFGFCDAKTGDMLLQLAESGPLPDFTLAYFPDNDFLSHDEGPAAAERVLEEVDSILSRFIETCGGLQAFLKDHAILITGDHAQSDLPDDEQEAIDLENLYDGYQIATLGKTWAEGDELMLCPNMRVAEVYTRPQLAMHLEKLGRKALEDHRVDQAIWHSSTELGTVYHVMTAERGSIQFCASDRGVLCGDDHSLARDDYGATWNWQGDLEAVAATVADGTLRWDKYPNAFERIATGFSPTSADLMLSAKLGHEFRGNGTQAHRRGSHSSLHIEDSHVPLIAAGLPDGVSVPAHPRTVDIAPLCVAILGCEGLQPIGASHVRVTER